jgi:L-fuconolactonase
MIIDSHVHVWDRRRARYDWLAEQSPRLNRDVRLAEIEPTLARCSIGGVVLVQSADNAEDTSNMLATADAHPAVRGVVGWVPLDDPAAAASRLDTLRRDARLVGIRNLIHERRDPDWVLRPEFDAGLALLAGAGLPFDYVTRSPEALRHVVRIGERHPGLTLVIDHLGKPPIGRDGRAFRDWAGLLSDAAANPNVVAKVSGLYASVGAADGWTQPDVERVVEAAVEIFGPERLMYGGDWPMSTLAGGYLRVWTSLTAALGRVLDERGLALVLGGTARRVYRLDTRPLADAAIGR